MFRGSLRWSESLSSPTKEAAALASLRGGVNAKMFSIGGGTIVHRVRGFSGREVFSRQAQSSRYSLTPLVAYLRCKDMCERLNGEEK